MIEMLNDIKNIERIRYLHEQLLENKDKFMIIERGYTRTIGIVYELKNGRKVIREYEIPSEFIESNQYIKKIYESREYKVNHYEVFDLDIDKLNYLELQSDAPIEKERIKVIDTNEIKEVISIIESDILKETYEEFCDFANNWGDINIYYENKNNPNKLEKIPIKWKRSYEGLTKWLKDKGYYERIVIMPRDVEYIIVEETSEDLDVNNFFRTIDMEELDKDKEAGRILIKKSSEIEEILNKCSFSYFGDKKYVIGVYLKNGKKLVGWMD